MRINPYFHASDTVVLGVDALSLAVFDYDVGAADGRELDVGSGLTRRSEAP